MNPKNLVLSKQGNFALNQAAKLLGVSPDDLKKQVLAEAGTSGITAGDIANQKAARSNSKIVDMARRILSNAKK